MGRRSRAGGKQIKARHRKSVSSKVTRRRGSAAAGEKTKFAQLRRELNEALEREAATTEVLKAVSQSAFDLKSVLQTLVVSAARLCKADKAGITRQIGGEFFFTEAYGVSSEFIEYISTVPVKPERGTVLGVALLEGRAIHVSNLRVPRDKTWAKAQKLAGVRTMLGVPMLRDGMPIGLLSLMRTEAEPFTDKQIDLVENFAAQTVIAIENTRLLNELRHRTDDLSESLEQQTATSDVLKVISSSRGELQPVFEAMLDNAMRICDARFGVLLEFANGAFDVLSTLGVPPSFANFIPEPRVWGPDTGLGRLARTKQTVHVHDAREGRVVVEREPNRLAAIEKGGVRTFVAVPMLKENELIGVIVIFRQEVRPFTEKQIELVTNFAAQAVIAIENARLLNELRQRTDDLSESLEQQTATSEVLRIISSSPGELEPVFSSMLANAVRI
jgi:GAF domain-containing protein